MWPSRGLTHAQVAMQASKVKDPDWDYRAHLLAECGDISANLSADLKGDISGSLHLWRLEAVEHLPGSPSEMASAAARLHEVCNLPFFTCALDAIYSGHRLFNPNMQPGHCCVAKGTVQVPRYLLFNPVSASMSHSRRL
jgi:hypothetical protein